MKSLHALLAAIPLIASLACGSSLNPSAGAGGTGVTGEAGSGGRGGTGVAGTVGTGGTGVGGAGGTSGTGGTIVGGTGGTGGVPVVIQPPRCLLDLIATCPLAGDCQSTSGDGGSRYCFAGGETVSTVTTAGGLGASRSVTEVRRADGSLCYTIEKECLSYCEGWSYGWKDAAGTVIATGYLGRDSRLECAGTDGACRSNFNNPREIEACVRASVALPTATASCAEGTCP